MKSIIVGLYLFVLVILSVYGLHRFFLIYLYYCFRNKPPLPQSRFSKLPPVTVQLPLYNELYVVRRLLKTVTRLSYPQELLEIQVLDDSTDETQIVAQRLVSFYQQKGFNIKYYHRNSREGFKAGALQYGLNKAQGEFILILDADFIPPPKLLEDTIHYFTDPKVGLVQARWGHLNKDYSLFTKIQSILLDGHLGVEQTARSRSGRFITFNGTAGIFRKKCIEDTGGWQGDTLTEDLDLSYRAQIKGWKFIYLRDIEVPAELPVEVASFKLQQYRWTKGTTQNMLKLLPRVFQAKLPLKVKIEAFFHLTSNLSYLMMTVLSILLLPAILWEKEINLAHPWRTLAIDGPIFIAATCSVVCFYLIAQKELYGEALKSLKYLPLIMALGIGLSLHNSKAIIEALNKKNSSFQRTPKYDITGKKGDWKGKKYNSSIPSIFYLELLFGIYYIVASIIFIQEKMFTALPFLMLYIGGYLFVSLATYLQVRPLHFKFMEEYSSRKKRLYPSST